MLQIAYFSTATDCQTPELMDEILSVARSNNARDGITGFLVAGGNRYLQIIEGPRLTMAALWAAIRADRRHCAVTEILNKRADARCFEGWSMAYQSEPRLGEFATFPQTLRFLVKQIEEPALRARLQSYARSFIADTHGGATTAWDR